MFQGVTLRFSLLMLFVSMETVNPRAKLPRYESVIHAYITCWPCGSVRLLPSTNIRYDEKHALKPPLFPIMPYLESRTPYLESRPSSMQLNS